RYYSTQPAKVEWFESSAFLIVNHSDGATGIDDENIFFVSFTHFFQNIRCAFAVVTAATLSNEHPSMMAIFRATALRYSGIFLLHRCGTGGRYGASVSKTI